MHIIRVPEGHYKLMERLIADQAQYKGTAYGSEYNLLLYMPLHCFTKSP